MTNFFVTYTMPDHLNRDGFYNELHTLKIDEKSRAEDGCIRYDYYYPTEVNNQLFLWEQWESRDAQKVHTTQPHFALLAGLKEKYSVTVELIAQDAAE